MDRFGFSEFGRVYIPIDIKPAVDITMSAVRFKVDTGADTTTISKKDLLRLGYDMNWIKQNAVIYDEASQPTTAAGEKVNAGYIQLPLINILGYEGKHWAFQIAMDEMQDFRNLLGRDLLTGFNYQFDNDNEIFSISRTKVFKPRFDFLPLQEINEIERSSHA
jgi:hypothetical protein